MITVVIIIAVMMTSGISTAFIPYQSILMDRLLASLHTVATASFLIAIADSFGYISTVSLYIGRDLFAKFTGEAVPWSSLLMAASNVVLIGVPLCMLGSVLYFRKHLKS